MFRSLVGEPRKLPGLAPRAGALRACFTQFRHASYFGVRVKKRVRLPVCLRRPWFSRGNFEDEDESEDELKTTRFRPDTHCAWNERSKTAGYPECFAQEALGHNSKSVHRACVKRAPVKAPLSRNTKKKTSRTPFSQHGGSIMIPGAVDDRQNVRQLLPRPSANLSPSDGDGESAAIPTAL